MNDYAHFGIDPDAPKASDRLGLARFLVDRGVALDDIRATHDLAEISMLAWSHIYGVAGEAVAVADAAAAAGVSDDQLERTIRALGFTDAGTGIAERDVGVLEFLGLMVQVLGDEQVLQLSRVIGSSMARIAEALAASTRVTVETPTLKEQPYSEFVRSTAPFVEAGINGVAQAMDRLLRYHMLAVSSRAWGTDAEGSAMTMELAVGFADMVGFTSQSAGLSTRDLTRVIDRFEGRVSETISLAGGRVVKFIGDEVLFTFADPQAACRCAIDLVALSTDEIPDVRVGLAYGAVVARSGDYYGPIVNLAARLEDIAPPGGVLVTRRVAERSPDHEFEEQTPRIVKGIDEPVEHLRLIR